MADILSDPTFQKVCLGTALIGATSGALGSFSYLRRQALIGDVISHSALLGVMGAFLLSAVATGVGSKSFAVLLPGALVAGVAAMLMARVITVHTRLKGDAALGVLLALFFGTGLLLLRYAQKSPNISGHAGLEDYIFGLAAAMTTDDLVLISALAAVALGATSLLWPALKLHTFDRAFAHSVGFHARRLDVVLILLQVLGIVIGIHAVGVVLMVSLMVAPAAAARQWTGSLGRMLLLAATFGAASGALGSLLSAAYSGAPTGPMIVLVATCIFVASILFAPGRGMLSRGRARRLARASVTATTEVGA